MNVLMILKIILPTFQPNIHEPFDDHPIYIYNTSNKQKSTVVVRVIFCLLLLLRLLFFLAVFNVCVLAERQEETQTKGETRSRTGEVWQQKADFE